MDTIISYGRFRCTELAPHKNKGMEITYIEEGMLEWMAEGMVEKIKPGSIYFTLPWQVHGSIHTKEPQNTVWPLLFQLGSAYSKPQPAFRFASELGFTDEEQGILSTAFAQSKRHCFPATHLIRTLVPALIAELQSAHVLPGDPFENLAQSPTGGAEARGGRRKRRHGGAHRHGKASATLD